MLKVLWFASILMLFYSSLVSAQDKDQKIYVREAKSVYLNSATNLKILNFLKKFSKDEISQHVDQFINDIFQFQDAFYILKYEMPSTWEQEDIKMFILHVRSLDKIDDLITERFLFFHKVIEAARYLMPPGQAHMRGSLLPYPGRRLIDELKPVFEMWEKRRQFWKNKDPKRSSKITFLSLIKGSDGFAGQKAKGLFKTIQSTRHRITPNPTSRISEIIRETNDPTLRKRLNYKLYVSLIAAYHAGYIDIETWRVLEAARKNDIENWVSGVKEILEAQKQLALHNKKYGGKAMGFLGELYKDEYRSVRQNLYQKFNYEQINLIKTRLEKLMLIITARRVEVNVLDKEKNIIHTDELKAWQKRDYAAAKVLRGIEELDIMPSFADKGVKVQYMDLVAVGAELGLISDRGVKALFELELIWEPTTSWQDKFLKFYRDYAVITTVLITPEWQWLVLFGLVIIQATDTKDGHKKDKKIGIYF